uniref:PQL-like protein n=1 Tax=Pelargonium transvaalense TaxID=158603 RepID=A0A0F7GX20_9ROSI
MVAIRPLVSQANPPWISPNFSHHVKPSLESRETTLKALHSKLSRRIGAIATLASVLLAGDAIFNKEFANGLDTGLGAPEQTIEEAESGIRGHARELLEVKALLDSESWRVAQKELRRSSSRLRQDLYTIIQNKPGRERPPLRKLFENIFTNVSNLDFAARDENASLVRECYKNIVAALDDLFSII